MKRRLVKKLMAVGIQRNDAAAFVKTYNAVKAAGKISLFRELELPPAPPIHRVDVKPARYRVMRIVPKREMEVTRGNALNYAQKRLLDDLIKGLFERGLVCIKRKDTLDATVLAAEICTIPVPEEFE